MSILNVVILVLRPHQQKRIQQALEEFTLRLEYIDTTRILNILSNPDEVGAVTRRIARFQVKVLVFELVLVSLLIFFLALPLETIIYLLSALIVMVALIHIGMFEKSMRWFVGSAHLFSFCIRYALLVLIVLIFGKLWMIGLLDRIAKVHMNLLFLSTRDVNTVFFLLPLMAFLSIALYIGACWIILEIGRRFLLNGIIVSRGIAWRVVEFNKGAAAALVLIVTVFLGFATQFAR